MFKGMALGLNQVSTCSRAIQPIQVIFQPIPGMQKNSYSTVVEALGIG